MEAEKWLVVFLGNPGSEYEYTRHNVGFIIADRIIDGDWILNKYANALEIMMPDEYRTEKAQHEDPTIPGLLTVRADVRAIKPLTFMNLSGKSVRYYCEKEHIKRDQIIVVYDDVDVMVGQFKLSQGRGDGNHNGIKSLIAELGTKNFIRIRVGVGSVDRYPGLASFVLGKFRDDERELVAKLAPQIKQCVQDVVRMGTMKAMNIYN